MEDNCTVDKGLLWPGFCAQELTSDISVPRGVVVSKDGHILVLERGSSSIVLVKETGKVTKLATASGLNHGLAIDRTSTFIYASSKSAVYRWPYSILSSSNPQNVPSERVIHSIDNIDCTECGAPGGHSTRTLDFDTLNRLYVSVGSQSNVDNDSFRSRIRRFNMTSVPNGGVHFFTGEVFADGLRNEVGLAFDKHGVLWGVENSCDGLSRADLGGDIHNNNPAEELNRFPEELAGSHWGYPFCFTEYNLPEDIGDGKGSVWAHPSFLPSITDMWCVNNTEPPALAMQAHSAPLGITFYDYSKVELFKASSGEECEGQFPEEFDGDAFIGFHGSWNRNPPTGYKVVRVPMTSSGFVLDSESDPFDFFCSSGPGARFSSGLRPVDLDFDRCGRLVVTSDGTQLNSGYIGSKVLLFSFSNSTLFLDNNSTDIGCNETSYFDGRIKILIMVFGFFFIFVLLVGGLYWQSNIEKRRLLKEKEKVEAISEKVEEQEKEKEKDI